MLKCSFCGQEHKQDEDGLFACRVFLRTLIIRLMHGIEEWAHDEDGIHPFAWEAYRVGIEMLGGEAKYDKEKEDLVVPSLKSLGV